MSSQTEHSNPYEKSDADVKKVAYAGIAILVIVIVVIFAMSFFTKAMKKQINARYPKSIYQVETQFSSPETQLETHPSAGLEALRAEEHNKLHSYGWVDEEKKVARIPIEKAMDKMLKKGFEPPAKDQAS